MNQTNNNYHVFDDSDGIGECSVRIVLPGNGWYRCAKPKDAKEHQPKDVLRDEPSAKQRVMAVWPDLHVLPIPNNGWYAFSQHDRRMEHVIGVGNTEAEAVEDAASKLSPVPPSPIISEEK